VNNPSRLLKKAFSTACALTLVSPEAGEKIRKEASFTQGVESLRIAILGFPGVFQHPANAFCPAESGIAFTIPTNDSAPTAHILIFC
jgi:hypothetical protein